MKIILIAAAGLTAVQMSAAPVDWSKLPPAATVAGVTFDRDITPIFKASCVRCHSGDRARGQLRLDSLDGVLKGSKDGPVLTAGDSANSLIVKAVSQLDPQTAMPPKPRRPRPMGTNAPAMAPLGGPEAGGPPPGGPGGPPPMTGPGGPPPMDGPGGPPPGGPEGAPGTNGPGQFPPRQRPMSPPPKPLTAEQVGLIRAWIDQGAK
ncbi:MAG: c-type cytochrome domain-containing protein [Verrucomicrobiota bacterium]|jgi:hypothetical protein